MKQAIPNLLKLAGALAITTAIFFLVVPEEKMHDEVLNASLEFLGNKLLAMAPKEQRHNVEREFETLREQTLKGEVSDEHLENFAVTILNADAEGRRLKQEQIDSMLATIRASEAKRRASESHLRELGERLQAYRKFEDRWKSIVPEGDLPKSYAPPPRPMYRVAPNLVVQIDTAAMAEAAALHAQQFATELPAVVGVAPPPNFNFVFHELSRELPELKIEFGQIKVQIQIADSLKKVHMRMADSLKRVIHLRKLQQNTALLPIPSPPPEEAKPEKRNKPK